MSSAKTDDSRFSIPILYRKGFLLAADKPAGIPIHATLDPKRENFEALVLKQEKLPYLRLVHRLDRDTSGLVLFCTDPERNKDADSILSESEKTYICITEGISEKEEFRVECFLKEGKDRMISVRSGGKKAITDFKILGTNPKLGLSLIQARLVTGRRHQIRFHLASIGIPILGDRTYGFDPPKKKSGWKMPDRFLLHSYLLKFKNEFGEEISLNSPIPEDFSSYLSFFSGIHLPN
ncbi:RNA pseudouridine synthase [Leptospira wolffii]|uniref:RNA pseudouridine synthase n=1 Tax=Leptospira wolffii TaxID=409998 RepID=A0A2M9ZBE4_9LEPT|nr:RNA pseudouridine synthase [Leptospira wolffii]PJZ65743.1 RNA pseudouridine synthase [Leptospira wolffii]